MLSGIERSLEKVDFAKNILKGRDVRGSFEKPEYFSQKNVIVRDKNRKDRSIRQQFRRTGKAPALLYIPDEKQEEVLNNQEEEVNESEQIVDLEPEGETLDKPKVKKLTIEHF